MRPKLSFGWLFLRATRLPFLTATFVPILLGIAVAALDERLQLVARAAHARRRRRASTSASTSSTTSSTRTSGADEANVNPTQFSGGSRVILYGL